MKYLIILFLFSSFSHCLSMERKCTATSLDTVEKSVEDCGKNEAIKTITDLNQQSKLMQLFQMAQLCSKLPNVVKKCGVDYSTCYPDYVIR